MHEVKNQKRKFFCTEAKLLPFFHYLLQFDAHTLVPLQRKKL